MSHYIDSWLSLDEFFSDDDLAAELCDLGADVAQDYRAALLLLEVVPVDDRLEQDYGLGDPGDAVGGD